MFLEETGYLTSLLCAVSLNSEEVRRDEEVVTMVKGLNQEKWLSKRASRLQNSKIEVRGEAGVPDVHTLTLKLVTQAFLW